MNEFLQRDLGYVIRLDEVTWGCLLVAFTLVIHGVGLFYTMRLANALMPHTRKPLPGLGMSVVVLASLLIIVVHLIEVMVWAAFFMWKDAQPNPFSAFYNALVNYTTLGANYLPLRWRLLEGSLGMAGLLAFAFSTSVLITLAQALVERGLTEQQQTHRNSGSRRTEG